MPNSNSGLRSVVAALSLVIPALAEAQTGQPATTPPQVILPTVTVTAQKEPADPQNLPVSVTAVPFDPLWNGGFLTIGDLSMYSPNSSFTDFTARKLSNPRFRGIGSSPANPAITTYIDGVPQLNTNSSSIELLDVSQVEFVRGPQSALFGRNTLGGLVNISSTRPSLSKWGGSAVVPFGNYSSVDVRAQASGPLGGKAAVGFALGHAKRDGFTKNDVTGHDLDYRDALFGKAQLLVTPNAKWEVRGIYTGERARDGDYALSDLGGLRQNPLHTMRDFEGHTDRDIHAGTFIARYAGNKLSFSSTTGLVHWKTLDATDLDYSPLPLLTRSNDEQDTQFTQEFRVASGPAGAAPLGKKSSLRWQAGVFTFSQNYDQDAVNTYAPGLLSPQIPFSLHEHNPQSSLDDTGIGVYGNGTFMFDRFDLTVGARADHENRNANLASYFVEFTTQLASTAVEKSFSNVSPQAALAYHIHPGAMAYFSVTGGYKAGGFNPAAPAGSEAYGEEHTWNYEGGIKSTWLNKRVLLNFTVFSIDWKDLQLNVPNQQVPGQFFVSNAGQARSHGVEAEFTGKVNENCLFFGSLGTTHARFEDNSFSSGVPVAGKKIPNTPDYTASLGGELSHAIGHGIRAYGRGEAAFSGAFEYDDFNTQGQDAYALANFRFGARGNKLFAEGWIRNAFDTKYIPVAFAYGQLAPSGFIGESGRPRTFGLTLGVSF
jgi:iron complex outermembrane receptor protein